MRRHTVGSLAVAGCALAWGWIAILVREIEMPALVIVFFRVLLAAAGTALLLLVARRRDLFRVPAYGRWLPLFGVLLALHWFLYFKAIQQTSVASAVLITYAAPVLMALLAPLLIGEHVPAVAVAALGLSVVGIVAITVGGQAGGQVRSAGVALALGAAVTYALLIVMLKILLRQVSPLTVALYESTSATIVLAPFALTASFELDAAKIGYLLLLGLVLTGALGIVYIGALRHLAVTTAGILSYLEPVAAAMLAWIVLGERLTASIVAGGLLILLGGVLVVLRSPEPGPVSIEEPVAP